MGASLPASPAHHGRQLSSIPCTPRVPAHKHPVHTWEQAQRYPLHTMGAGSRVSCAHYGCQLTSIPCTPWVPSHKHPVHTREQARLQGSSTTPSVREKEGKHSRRWRLSSFGTLSRPVGKSCPHGNHTGQTDQRPAKFLRGSHGQRNHRVGLQNSG